MNLKLLYLFNIKCFLSFRPQVSVSQAVGQNCALYGRLVPYLNTLHLYEHYYIRGTIGADTEAIQLYAKLGKDRAIYLLTFVRCLTLMV